MNASTMTYELVTRRSSDVKSTLLGVVLFTSGSTVYFVQVRLKNPWPLTCYHLHNLIRYSFDAFLRKTPRFPAFITQITTKEDKTNEISNGV